MSTKYRAPNGNATVGALQLFATSNGDGTYIIGEPDGTTLVASTQGPSINAAATALRARGEPLTISLDLLVKCNDNKFRPFASGEVAQGQAYLMERTVA